MVERLCPSCQRPMEPGSLGSEVYLQPPKWFKDRSSVGASLGFGGDKVARTSGAGMAWLDGFRCVACGLLLLDTPRARTG